MSNHEDIIDYSCTKYLVFEEEIKKEIKEKSKDLIEEQIKGTVKESIEQITNKIENSMKNYENTVNLFKDLKKFGYYDKIIERHELIKILEKTINVKEEITPSTINLENYKDKLKINFRCLEIEDTFSSAELNEILKILLLYQGKYNVYIPQYILIIVMFELFFTNLYLIEENDNLREVVLNKLVEINDRYYKGFEIFKIFNDNIHPLDTFRKLYYYYFLSRC